MSLRDTPRLDTLERWMQAVVMHPDGAEAGVKAPPARRLLPIAARDLGAVVLRSKSLTSLERIGIYAHMYHARLFEVLDGEYPTTKEILGEDAFHDACREYVRRHPSRHRTLNRLSEKLPAFLARHLPRSRRNALAVDVARIERAMEDVFDAPRAEPLTAADFAKIGAKDWDRVRLRVNPALKFLELRYPANEYMNAVRARRKPRVPAPRKSWVVVCRRGFQVLRRDQDSAQFRLLQALAAGKSLAQAVRASASRQRGSADKLADRLGGWFREWAAAEIFCR